MMNLFDPENYSKKEPRQIVSGSAVGWIKEIGSVYSPEEYTLLYRFDMIGSDFSKEITATALNSNFVISISSSTTAEFLLGSYRWSLVIVRDSDQESIELDSGVIDVKSSAASSSELDWCLSVLSAIRAAIEGTASKDQAGYSINGRSLSRRTPEELMKMEREFSRRANRLQLKANKETKKVLVTMGA